MKKDRRETKELEKGKGENEGQTGGGAGTERYNKRDYERQRDL